MSQNDAALLEEIRERKTYGVNELHDIQEEARKDRLCVAGQPWLALDPAGAKQRKAANRPLLALDELGQYINQTVNDVRANPRGLKFAPTGNGANDEGAEFYANHTREIEYRSHARVAYSTAFESGVTSSYGWLRVRTKREHIRTFNQDIWIEPIVNPDQVIPDPHAMWPDSRDMQWLFFLEPWANAEFARRFPGAKKGLSRESRGMAADWFGKDTTTVGEYWRIVKTDRQLIAYRATGQPDGEVQFALLDELPDGRLPAGMDNIRNEKVEDSKVESYLTNGIDILERNGWKGRHIPFVSCFGKVLYVDEGAGPKRRLLSMTRLARDPYLLYCYYRTTEAELVGATPRFPYFAYEGQLSKSQLALLQKANHEPVAVIQIKATVDGAPANSLLPHPQRNPYDPPIEKFEIGAEAARRAIQAAMGISPLPTDAQRHSQKSGVALRQIESSGQKGSFHFVDHYELMIERTGVIIEDLITPILDTARDVAVRKANGDAAVVRINDQSADEKIFTKGDYRVTISTGPADASQREAADNFVDGMVTNITTLAPIIGPQKTATLLSKSIKLKQLGPIGDEIAELLEPPKMQGPDGKPLSPEVQALMTQVQQLQQQLQQAVQTIEQDTHTEEVKGQLQIKLKEMDLQFQREKLDVESETKTYVAELGAKVDKLTVMTEALQSIADHLHTERENAKDRMHERMAADASHQQALEQSQAGVQGQMALADQAAANHAPEAAGA
jgi:TolA-binding protein